MQYVLSLNNANELFSFYVTYSPWTHSHHKTDHVSHIYGGLICQKSKSLRPLVESLTV